MCDRFVCEMIFKEPLKKERMKKSVDSNLFLEFNILIECIVCKIRLNDKEKVKKIFNRKQCLKCSNIHLPICLAVYGLQYVRPSVHLSVCPSILSLSISKKISRTRKCCYKNFFR